MKVALDGTFLLLNQASGLRTYTRHLAQALLDDPSPPDLTLFYHTARGPDGRLLAPWREETLPAWAGRRPHQVVCRIPRRLLHLAWRCCHAPPIERLVGEVELYHSVHLLVPPTRKARTVLTVHDLREFRLPHLYRGLQAEREARARMARAADHVVTVSECTRRDAIECLGLPPERVSVVHNGLDAAFLAGIDPASVAACRARLRLERPYLLCLSSLDPRKDLPTTLRAAELLRARRAWDGELVVAGLLPPGVALGAARAVGVVDDDTLRPLMAGADALLFSSLYEGFGFPVLEAMAMGTPVVAAATSSIPEVAGDAARLVPAGDADAMASAVVEVLGQADLRAAMVERGRRQARSFSWQAHAARLLEVYRRVLG